ncbi:response regulator [Pseudoprevotella muciniphila]|uniref:Response regulator n=1 Tax=Pseudoprevotella muciniphila TaxID=2133944 RepID=A0A5P8E9F5_9BACT|nr:response regulator [Pseudoprevotella muciniphila]QFQ13572.1 response regulator [Pseudoprevotella muciniphila]
MIYLIDDKESRQRDYGWDEKMFQEYSEFLIHIRDVHELKERYKNIFNNDNVLLIHESFPLDNWERDFHTLLNENKLPIAFFSGSKNARFVEDNICMLPPNVLYANLATFVKTNCKTFQSFRTLAFGENDIIEEEIRQRVKSCKIQNTKDDFGSDFSSNKKMFFAIAQDNIDEVPFLNDSQLTKNWDFFSEEKLQKQISDIELDSFVRHFLSNVFYDVIYIPLYFGNVWSDYLGLRLALHIRLTKTINQRTPIFIYGVSSIDELINNECFDVLKLSGVRLIQSDNKSLVGSLSDSLTTLSIGREINKIYLPIPTNIGDNHSVVNKWSIYRWSKTLGDWDKDIKKNNEDIYTSLYFKYLTILYPESEISYMKDDYLRLKKTEQMDINVVLVDDEADKGWYELICHILSDVNGIVPDYIGDELNGLSQEQIISLVMDKIKNDNDINIVILDLRLNPIDFDESVKNMTGYKLLKEIKNHNRGIQVLMFSATNKIWNLQELQKAEADGFIIKEAPENSIDSSFTKDVISQFVDNLSRCSCNIYRKALWEKFQNEKKQLEMLRRRKKINMEYERAVRTLLTMTEDALFSQNLKYPFATAFMNLFRIIEATANEWIETEPVVEKDEKGYFVRSFFKTRKSDSILLKFNSKQFEEPYRNNILEFDKENPKLPYFQKICNTLYIVGCYNSDAFEIVVKRNSFTHPNLIENSEIEQFTQKDVLSIAKLVDQLIMNQ